jgi:hypothetical protein
MQPDQGKKIAKRTGCGICGCFFGVFGFVGVIIYFTVFSNFCARMMGEETYPFKTDTRRFDPFAALGEVRAKVGVGGRLTEIDASFVRSDGTMDLKASYKPAPNVTYRFLAPLDKAPENAPPIGAGRGPDDVWVQDVTVRCYEPGMRRHVSRTSGGSTSSYSYTNEGMDIDRGTPSMRSLGDALEDPKLTTKEMWDLAIKKGADKNAVATIKYDADGYEFRISGLSFNLEWDKNGEFNEGHSRYPGQER